MLGDDHRRVLIGEVLRDFIEVRQHGNHLDDVLALFARTGK
jgi:hypothetical protein